MRRTASIVMVFVLVISGLAVLAPAAQAALPRPHADAGPDQTVSEGDTVTLDGSASYDLTPGETLSYTWDFDDSNGSTDIDARGEVVTTVYEDAGIYTVTLTVSDGDFEDTDTARITVLPGGVSNIPPKAIIREPLPGVYNRSAPVNFSGDAIDPDDRFFTGTWDFGDGTTSNLPETTHRYSQEGVYYITWTVNDGEANNTARTVIYIGERPSPGQNERPNAVIIGPDDDIPMGTRAFFTGKNSTDPDNETLSFDWDFDLSDGLQQEASGMEVWWWFNQTGDFQVSLQVRDGNTGGWDIDFFNVTVVVMPNEPPEVNAGNDAEVMVNVPLSFRGTATDPDGDNITRYIWDFGDGDTWESNVSQRVNHTYTSHGEYTATFTAEDERGAQGSDTRHISVRPPDDRPPTAIAGEDMTIKEGDVAYFSGRGTDDFGIAKYEWDFDSDGVWDFENTRTGDASYTGYEPGVFTAILRVTDQPKPGVPGPGQTDEDSLIVTVLENQAPTAKIVVSTLFWHAGELVTFRSDSSDPEGARLKYAWDLDGDQVVDSTSSSPSITYFREGDYQVTLTVTDDFDQSDTDTITITVNQDYELSLVVASPIRELDPGDTHEFRATVTNEGNGIDDVKIALTGVGSEWATLDPSKLTLDPSAKETITIRVSVPASALATEEALISVTASSENAAAIASDEIEVTVRQQHAVSATVDVNTIYVEKGERNDSVARVTITNDGNGEDTFRISFSGDITGYLTPDARTVTLQPGESRDIAISVAVVETSPSGKATGTILVSSTGSTAKMTLDFEINIRRGDGGDGGGIELDERTLIILIAVVVVITVLAALGATASRKRRAGPRRKVANG